MSDTPKFEVIDRRKIKAAEEKDQEPKKPVASEPKAAVAESSSGPRLVVPDPDKPQVQEEEPPDLPPAPSAEESRQQKSAYEASAQRVEDLVRAQNPGIGAQPPVGFEHLVQQLYLTAMLQMGAGTEQGQRARVDILGARQTIDLLGVLAEKTKRNLSEIEDRALQSVLFELRMAFLELTNMITMQGVPAPPPPAKR